MVKSSISHRRQYGPLDACVLKTLGNPDTGSHRNLRPARIQWSIHTNDRAANISRSDHLVMREAEPLNRAVECVIRQAMWAARTELQRAWWGCGVVILSRLSAYMLTCDTCERSRCIRSPGQLCNRLFYQLQGIVTHPW